MLNHLTQSFRYCFSTDPKYVRPLAILALDDLFQHEGLARPSDSVSAYHDSKHLASDVLLLLLSRLPASFVPMVLSYELVQCLTDMLPTKDIWLHKVAQYFLKDLSDWVRYDDVRKVYVIMAL